MVTMNEFPDDAELRSRLLADGLVLLRGAQMTMDRFESILSSQCRAFHQPATRADEQQASHDGYTSRVGRDGRLLGHAEGYYRPCLPPPDVCLFWCEQAPVVEGGETTWLDAAALFDALPRDLSARLADEGVVYEAMWSPERWMAEFPVANMAELRDLLDRDARCRYGQDEQGNLLLFFKTMPVLLGQDGVRRFINGMLAHLPEITHQRYKNTQVYCKVSNRMHWGRGGLISNADVNRMLDAHDAVLNKHRWVDGDLLILDNHRLLHGREMMPVPGERVIYSRFGFWS